MRGASEAIKPHPKQSIQYHPRPGFRYRRPVWATYTPSRLSPIPYPFFVFSSSKSSHRTQPPHHSDCPPVSSLLYTSVHIYSRVAHSTSKPLFSIHTQRALSYFSFHFAIHSSRLYALCRRSVWLCSLVHNSAVVVSAFRYGAMAASHMLGFFLVSLTILPPCLPTHLPTCFVILDSSIA